MKPKKNYYVFNGADIVPFINNNILAEIESFGYNTINKEIEIRCVIFNSLVESNKILTNLTDAKILCVYVNEYDCKMYRLFSGVFYKGEKGVQSVIDAPLKTSYILRFESVTPYIEFENPLDELREEIFNSK